MTNESAILGLLAEIYNDRLTLVAENAQLHADLQRLETALGELRTRGATPDAPLDT